LGFTLVEVLVALAVLAIALAAVMRVVTQAIDTTAALRDRTIALGVAEDRLALHRLQNSWPALDTFDGVREQGGREWVWREKVVSTEIADFRRIEVEVRVGPEGEILAHAVGFLRKP
jgi:general secretion pathway protein I